MKNYGLTAMIVFFGAGFGGVLRHCLVSLINKMTFLFPPIGGFASLGTATVNLVGCFIAGLLLFFLLEHTISQNSMLFFVTGVLGGFTTFSAFSLETVLFLQKNQVHFAFCNVMLSLGSIFMTYIGYIVARWF